MKDPYRQFQGYDNRNATINNRQGATFGDINHSRQSSQGQYSYPTPQGSDVSPYYQGQPFNASQSRMGLPLRASDMMGHLTLEQAAANSPTPGHMPLNRYNESASRSYHKNFSCDKLLTFPQAQTNYSAMQSRRPESRASRSSFGQESSHGSYGFRDLQNPLDTQTSSSSDRQNAQQQHQSSQINLLPPLSGSQTTSLTSQDPFNFGALPHRDTNNPLLSSQQASTTGFSNPGHLQNQTFQNGPDQQLSAFAPQLPLSGEPRSPSRAAEPYASTEPPPPYAETQTGYESAFQSHAPSEYYPSSQWHGGS